MLSKKLFFAFIACIIVLAVLLFSLMQLPEIGKQENNLSKLGILENSLLVQRAGYGIPSGVFEELPKPPADFNKLVFLMLSGKFQNYAFFSKEYYLQPEFYPSFLPGGLQYWTNPSRTHYAAMGFGFFPKRQSIEVKKGNSATARFFIHSGFGVQSFQGIRIEALIPESSSFLRAEIQNPEFLLGPSFPKFSKNWSNAVDVRISVPSNSPSGKFEINFKVSNPSAENSALWNSHYKNYFDASASGVSMQNSIIVKVV